MAVTKPMRIGAKERALLDKMLPNMLATFDKGGDILPQDEVVKIWGQQIVDYAIEKEVLTRVIVKKNATMERRPALHTAKWNKGKPIWL